MAGSDEFLATPEAIIRFAWSAPMRELASKVGISDVGLRKLLVDQNVALPPQGHWNRVHAGRSVAGPPAPPPRGPGEAGRIHLDSRFRGLVEETGPIPEDGPFLSAAVPENLDELQTLERKKIGRVPVAKDLGKPHPALRALLGREEKRRQKQVETGWRWDGPKWAGPLAQRQLLLLDSLFKALAQRDHSAWIRTGYEQLEIWCKIGSMQLELAFTHTGWKAAGRNADNGLRGDMSASTPMRLSLVHSRRTAVTSSWEDGSERLERRIGEIAADLIVAGEAAFRDHLVEMREWAEQTARWNEERRRAELEKLDKQRLSDLRASGALLREAAEIRTLVEQVRTAIRQSTIEVSDRQFQRWETWALGEADRLDPVKSGQILSHLCVPALDGDDCHAST